MATKCTFDKAWIGKCAKPAVTNDRCEEHNNVLCVSCQKPATRECEHTGTQFVCGYPLCDNCEHNAPEPGKAGIFGLGGGHCDKETAQKNWEKYFQVKEAKP